MSQSTWRASPTTAGRSIYSQYKPDHAKEWITSEDRRQQKGVYGSLEPDLTDGLTSYRDSLYRPTVGQHIEKKHNANSKTLAELRQLLVTSDMAPLTASSPDRVTVSTRPDIAASNLCDGTTYSPAFVHKHHFGWNVVTTAEYGPRKDFCRPKDGSRVVGSVEYCSKVTGKLAAMSSRRP